MADVAKPIAMDDGWGGMRRWVLNATEFFLEYPGGAPLVVKAAVKVKSGKGRKLAAGETGKHTAKVNGLGCENGQVLIATEFLLEHPGGGMVGESDQVVSIAEFLPGI